MPGECRLHGDFGCLAVAYFPDQDNVRVLPQGGTQNTGEIQPYLGIDFSLRYPGHPVLDRILHGGDADTLVINVGEHRIQCGRLATAGGPAQQHDSRRAVGHLPKRMHALQ